ncbi:ABC transporter permease [Hypericibacter adhaerens]|nr:ABC transporter permease [Hypericibacter adhaerens]
MTRMPAPGFLLVATRELRWIVRDRVALFLILGVPLIAFAILSLTFSSAVIRGLDIVVVDADRSPTSLAFVQTVAAAPGITLHQRADDLAAAMHAIRSGGAIAAVYIPENFERDLKAGRRPQISIFYNTQFLTPGNSAAKALQDAVRDAIAAVAPARPELPMTVGTLVVEPYVLTNPALNYAQFLLRAVLPTVLHVIIGAAAAYSVGSEFSRRSLRAWLRCAGGSPLVAIAGKLAPLAAIFIGLMGLVAVIVHGAHGVPFRGDSMMVAVSACLLLVAYLGLGSLMALLARDLPLGLSLTAILCSPAFGYAGVGFPVVAMLPFAKGWGVILPLRWYIEVLFDQGARGVPVSATALPFAALAGLAILYAGLAWWRLSSLAGKLPRTAAARASMPPPRPQPRGFGAAIIGEIRSVLGNRGALGLMVLAPILYGVFYPQPYLGQTLRNLPLAVVDQDRSELSRQLIMTLDADAGVKVALQADTLTEAQAALYDRKVFGILEIPVGTARDLLKGDPARLPAYVDAAYLLIYRTLLQGIGESVAAVNAGLATHDARAGGLADSLMAVASPAAILPVPLFNPTGGYASYIVPAAFILILQQTLLLGSAMLAGTARELGGRAAQTARGSIGAVVAHGLAHLVIYLPALLLYLVVLPRIYGFTAVGRLPDMFLFAATFLLATSFMGQAVGAWVKHRETAVVLFIATTLPQFFLVGVSWPVEAIPSALRNAGLIFPSQRSIDGLVHINQMGATLSEVSHDWLAVLALVLLYFLLAVLSTGLHRWRATRAA